MSNANTEPQPLGHDEPTPKFSSRAGFLLAAAGSAIGLGNIWRFPFVTGENGGGAFLLPYAIALLAVGIPAMVLELALGRSTGKGVVGSFAAISPALRPLGLVLASGSLLLLSYYLVVAGWASGYMLFALADTHPTFDEFSSGGNSVYFFGLTAAVTIAVVWLGVNGGIERFSKILMPLLAAVLVGLMIYSLTLEGRDDALRFYLVPEFGVLSDPVVWVRAIGQVFFSVGVGGGILITYGAYMKSQEGIVGSSAIVVGADSAMAFIAGLVIFPIVFTLGFSPDAGPQLAFDTLPRVFDGFTPVVGYVVAVLFYFALSVAAVTSAIALLETSVVAIIEYTGMHRKRSLGISSALLIALGLPSALSYAGGGIHFGGERLLDVMDTAIGTLWLPVGVLLTVVVVGWKGFQLVHAGLERWGRWESVAIALARWVVPVAIAATLVALAADLLLGRVVPEAAG